MYRVQGGVRRDLGTGMDDWIDAILIAWRGAGWAGDCSWRWCAAGLIAALARCAVAPSPAASRPPPTRSRSAGDRVNAQGRTVFCRGLGTVQALKPCRCEPGRRHADARAGDRGPGGQAGRPARGDRPAALPGGARRRRWRRSRRTRRSSATRKRDLARYTSLARQDFASHQQVDTQQARSTSHRGDRRATRRRSRRRSST